MDCFAFTQDPKTFQSGWKREH